MKDHAIIIVDTDGVIRMWNEGAERLLGHAATAVMGQSLDLIVPEAFRAAHWAAFRAAMANGELQQPRTGVLPLLNSTSEEVPLLGTLSLVHDAKGQVIGAMGVLARPDEQQ